MAYSYSPSRSRMNRDTDPDSDHHLQEQCVPEKAYSYQMNNKSCNINEGTPVGSNDSESGNYEAGDPTSEKVANEEILKSAVAKDEDEEGDSFEGFEADEDGAKDMIANIFGESDTECDGDFEGFAENEVEGGNRSDYAEAHSPMRLQHGSGEAHHLGHENDRVVVANHGQQEAGQPAQGESDDSESNDQFESDFSNYLRRRKEANRRRRRGCKMSSEILNDADEIISELAARMRAAAEEDRKLVAKNRPATNKIAMLPEVSRILIRADIQNALCDSGILSAITEWLSPVSGHTLPSIGIRETLLKHLRDLHIQDPDLLQESGIGKAVMYLYKHPRETRANKQRAGYLINEWSRPIFNLQSDYASISREERCAMDMRNIPKRRLSSEEGENGLQKEGESQHASATLRPGDPGYVNRARVPQPSTKDYVVRPKWNTQEGGGPAFEDDGSDNEAGAPHMAKRSRMFDSGSAAAISATSRLERNIRTIAKSAASRRRTRFSRAVTMSLEGRNMSL